MNTKCGVKTPSSQKERKEEGKEREKGKGKRERKFLLIQLHCKFTSASVKYSCSECGLWSLNSWNFLSFFSKSKWKSQV